MFKLSGGFIRRAIIRMLILAIYNLIVFIVPFEHHTAFWWSYVFGMIALVAQWLIIEWTLGVGTDVRSQFYGFPVARVGWIYLFTQMALSVVFILTGSFVPTWIVILIYFVWLLLAGVGVVTMDITRSEIIRQDKELIKETAVIRTFTTKVSVLSSKCPDDASRKAVNVLAEALRFSDPVSCEESRDIEERIDTLIADLQFAVDCENNEAIVSCSEKIIYALTERNQICKREKIKSH